MFTGLIREVGTVVSLRPRAGGAGVELKCPSLAAGVAPGDSVCVDGACLTAEDVRPDGFTAFASGETLRRSTLGDLRGGDRVNLEPALRASDRLGGHLVQGHVEGVGEVASVRPEGEGALLVVRIPGDLLLAIVAKGSIALAGISLTVVDAEKDRASMSVIPTTLDSTTLGSWRPGRRVNVETDLVGRHVVRYMEALGLRRSLTVEDLHEKGF